MNTKYFFGVLLLVFGVLVGWYILGGKLSTAYPGIGIGSRITVMPTQIQKKADDTMRSTSGSEVENVEKGGAASRSVVTYTDTGFAPYPLTVKKGTTVTFVNESGVSMLVGSATYPSHSLLPDFVQKIEAGKGKTFEYTFKTAGTWRYQNDIRSVDVGSIIVTE